MDNASQLISRAIDSGEYQDRLNQWNQVKWKLHPDIFPRTREGEAERARELREDINQGDWTDFVKKITIEQAAHVIAFLDQYYPAWDSDYLNPWNSDYTLPAIQHLFPEQIKRNAGPFKFPRSSPHFSQLTAAREANKPPVIQ